MANFIHTRLIRLNPDLNERQLGNFIFKMCQPRPIFRLFSVFSNKHYNFTTNQCENMSIQYTALGFEPTTLQT